MYVTGRSDEISEIPGPAGHGLLGMGPELRRDLPGTLLRNFKRYGDHVLYRVGPARGPRWMQKDTVAVHHPDGVQRVLADDALFSHRTRSLRVLGEMFGQNLVTTDGELWRRQRRTLQPLFTTRQVEGYLPMMESEAQRVVRDHAVSSGEVIDLTEVMEGYALRVLGQTLFTGEKAIDEETVSALGRLVRLVGELVPSRAMQPLRLPLAWPTKGNRKFVEVRAELYAVVDRMLAARTAGVTAESADDLLGRLEQAHDPDSGEAVSAQEIRDQALVFLLAGHTTSSNAVTSTLHLLASHPEVQERVAEAAAGSAPSDGESDLVRGALQEGMRLYPPSSVLGRRVLADTEIDGWAISAGTQVLVSAWVTHRHPKFWKEPDRFDPSRFADGRYRAPGVYFPFGGGARTCIGRHFALTEASVIVREMLRAYRLEAVGDLPMGQRISLRPTGRVLVKCERR